ncbi:hypothetical protein L1S32_06645 [Methanogenium sp. S4BF]|uniref:hypothetical protein n=1 Tax=Methanogenium sp. S4BF TaxID=1789226 RepID=UPI002416F0FD|nr:hypothetical protein [Methanogenium sp. S4BF]WFN33534.1 hypothetical protein L1S32_06645 [Methanogenium sp. S4BF]
MQNRTATLLGFGLLTWLVPFAISIPLYSQTDIFLFKSIMIVVGAAVGAALLVLWFRGVHENHLREGITVGILWLIMNWALDIAILLPLSGSPASSWFAEIGLRYLVIPIMAVTVGYALRDAAGGERKEDSKMPSS